MATDKTEPPVKTILLIGSIAIGGLIGSEYLFQSYFNSMYGAEQQAQIYGVRSDLLVRTRDRDNEHLRNGNPVPIDQAMAMVARGDRPQAVVPQPSVDYAAMTGWTQMPREFNPAPIVASPPPPPPAEPTGVGPLVPGAPPPTGPTAAPVPAEPAAVAPGAPAPVAPAAAGVAHPPAATAPAPRAPNPPAPSSAPSPGAPGGQP
jgi:hypothetical protein